ncbi:MAG: GNAT family N-acetyltransferase [Firmicutes bacterium]|nr:GNAT family N-acetyltransferase [Bacillota bacterium]
MKQPSILNVDKNIRLRKTEESEWITALPWYENPSVLYYSEGIEDLEKKYNLDTIKRMYKYLSENGELYFIEFLEKDKWTSIGDVTLSENNFPIVIGDETYWGRGIGKKVIETLLLRAKNIGISKIYIPTIYKYNDRSRNLFTSLGFNKVSESDKEESFQLELDNY